MTMTAEIAGDTSGEIVNIENFSIIGAKMPAVSAMPDRAMPRAVNSIKAVCTHRHLCVFLRYAAAPFRAFQNRGRCFRMSSRPYNKNH